MRKPPVMNRSELEIASSAARLIVDEGLDYDSAKRRAAREFSANGRAPLPSSEQVEDAVREHIAIFCADTQPQELAALRALALRWMQRLSAFNPHLGGAVWRGTATRLSPVQIDLYADDGKAIELSLIDQRIAYEVHSPGGNQRPAAPDVLVVNTRSPELNDTVSLHLIANLSDQLRGALKPDARGRSWRGNAAALQTLMLNEQAPGPSA
jgi:hypothetical protein